MTTLVKTARSGLLAAAAVAAFGGATASAQSSCPALTTGVVGCIEQIGPRNTTTVEQVGATSSRARVSIAGARNGQGSQTRTSGVLRSFAVDPTPEGPSDLDVNDSGSVTNADGVSTGRRLTSTISGGSVVQVGDGHRATVEIAGSDNVFEIEQRGSNNRATQTIIGAGNAAGVLQTTGSGNRAGETQIGASNYGWVEQHGSNNRAELTQLGVGNTIQLEQRLSSNVATLNQTGVGHSIGLYQPGGATANITQLGANRTISVDQSGAGASQSISITQTGG